MEKSVVSIHIESHPHRQTLGRELKRRVASFFPFGAGPVPTKSNIPPGCAGKNDDDGGGATAAFSLAAVRFGLISPWPPHNFRLKKSGGKLETWPRAAMGFH